MDTQTANTISAPDPVFLNAPECRTATGVRAGDMDLIKSLSRQIMPEIKPGLRLEVLARAYGYKSAIAMRAAITEAIDEDIFLKPSKAPLDDLRLSVLLEALDDKAFTQESCDRFTSCAALVNAGLELSRGTWDMIARPHPEGRPHRKPTLAELNAHVQTSEAGMGTLSSGQWGPAFPEMALPDFRHLTFDEERFTHGGVFLPKDLLFENEDYIEVVSVSGGSPSRADIQSMGASVANGDVRQRAFASADFYHEEPKLEERSLSFTLLSRSADGQVKAFMTATFEIDHSSIDDDDAIREAIDKNDDDELTQADIEYFRFCNWFLSIRYSGYGTLAENREMEELDGFRDALFSFYQTIMFTIGDAANKAPFGVKIEVLPLEGEGFGFLTFEAMIDGVQEVINNFRIGEFHVSETEEDGFAFEMLDP